MSLIGQGETIDDINGVKLLGYFETIKGTFITKWVLLLHFLDDQAHLAPVRFQQAVIANLQGQFPFDLAYTALCNGNQELVENYKEDIVTSAIIGVWSVFEQLTKDLPNPNYAHNPDDASVNYQRNDFGFTVAEKRSLDVIYYVRNAIVHYNGAYYAYRDIDRHYAGMHFLSVGHHGEKIEISPTLTWQMIRDVEAFTIKAWRNYKVLHP